MSAVSYLRPPVIWLLTDNKPGHRNQLQGLAERLQARADAKLVWIEGKKHPIPLWRAVLGLSPNLAYPTPDIIVAAGTGTHRLLLSLRRKRKALTVVLMRPSFPEHWIDAAIIPAHDKPAERPGVLVTQGVLNRITPRNSTTAENQGLILVGGPSRHFAWDDESVYEQISVLSKQYPDWTWTLGSSRRTPESFIDRMLQANLANVRFFHHNDTAPDWLAQALGSARIVWVSPDSVSMLYEAMTVGLPTGLFELEPAPNSRVAQGVADLKRNGQIAGWSDRVGLMRTEPENVDPLWEADRSAQWLLHQWQQKLE